MKIESSNFLCAFSVSDLQLNKGIIQGLGQMIKDSFYIKSIRLSLQ